MYRALRAEVTELLRDALAACELPTADLGIEDPPDDVDAVLASSVAFRLASDVGKAPPAIAATLADEVEVEAATYIDHVIPAGPYLNFHPSQTYYSETLSAAANPDFGRLESTGESVVVEHTSANPTGPVHVGRARNPIVGDAIARLLDYAGNQVDRHYYVNDAGRQVALFTWSFETFDEADLDPPERSKPDYELVRYYRKGNAYLESATGDDLDAAEAEIQEIMQGLERGDSATVDRIHAVVNEVLSGMQATLDRLPAPFDEFIHETRFLLNSRTADVIERLKSLPGAVEEADGAWHLDLTDAGIDKELVFVRSDGTSLYPTRDIAHHEWKLEEYDRAVTVLGEDHKLQARQLRAALAALDNPVDRLEAIHYSWVNLPDGAGMSTRKGTGIDLDDLLDEAISRARNEVEMRLDTRIRDDELDDAAIERIAHQVGIGAVRYDIVSKQASKSITFDWDRALDFEAQSAPYLQYVHARCCGILDAAEAEPPANPAAELLDHPAEMALLESIARFPAVVEEASDDLAPHVIATYARDLAEVFNTFYRECSVTGDDVPVDRKDARLALVNGTRHTMDNTLWLLGIAAPRSM